MTKCDVYFEGDEKRYEGQYEIDDNTLEVEVFNHHFSNEDYVPIGAEVNYREITIVDLRNKMFLFSPVFYNAGFTIALTQYEKFKTKFFLSTSIVGDVEGYSNDMMVSILEIYNPVLIKCFQNQSLVITSNREEINYKIIKSQQPTKIEIKENNIEYIEFGDSVEYFSKNNNQTVSIETENYAKIYFSEPVKCEEILEYIKEFDVIIDAYCLAGLRSYKTYFYTPENKKYNVVHKLLGSEKHYNKAIYSPVKIPFWNYVKKMYKDINYRRTENRNKYIPLEFKKPTSLEDQYTFYFRYIDLYMGEYLKQETGNEPSNYSRLSRFVDDNVMFFNTDGSVNLDELKNELNSLRNHYVHEGYYLPNNQFSVTQNRKHLYYKTMDYMWLSRMVNIFKFGAYKILYKKVLELEIDESELRNALKCWW